MHLYAFLKARAALGLGGTALTAYALFSALMIFAPFAVRLSERAGFVNLAVFAAYAGYLWLGLMFLFVSASITLDACRLVIRLAGLIAPLNLSAFRVSAQWAFYAPLFLALFVFIYGLYEAGNIKTEKLVIKSEKIPEETGSITIAQISDVHIGLIVGERRLGKILDVVERANPDILVSTGDLVDGQMDDLLGAANLLKWFGPRYGKYAVTGNHEFYAGLGQALDFTGRAGFEVLRGKAIEAAGLYIAGVDDRESKRLGAGEGMNEEELLFGAPPGRFTLLLKHRPFVQKNEGGVFDLQLSGHTHKGQIFPFGIVTRLSYAFHSGTRVLPEGGVLHVSRGTGTWGPPIRFLSPPEVTVIEIVHGK